MTPLVSVIVPCFNAAPWLGEAIESVLAQTHPAIETIVVDDGSTDESVAVARRYAPRGVQVVTQPNRGASAARNHGLRLARGAFIQFFDADDVLGPEKIALQLRLLADSPEGCIAAGPWARFHDDRKLAVTTPEENWRDAAPVDWLALNFAGRGMMPPAAWLAPRTLVVQAGPWDERLSLNDDGEYFCRVLLASRGVRFCPDALSYYRSNVSGSLSRRRSEAAWRSALLSQELCATHLLTHQDSSVTRRACADLFQRLAYAAYPDSPAIARAAEEHALRHGGSTLRPEGGRLFRLLSATLGWKRALRLQAASRR